MCALHIARHVIEGVLALFGEIAGVDGHASHRRIDAVRAKIGIDDFVAKGLALQRLPNGAGGLCNGSTKSSDALVLIRWCDPQDYGRALACRIQLVHFLKARTMLSRLPNLGMQCCVFTEGSAGRLPQGPQHSNRDPAHDSHHQQQCE